MKKKTLAILSLGIIIATSCEKIPMNERVKDTGTSCGDCVVEADDVFVTSKNVLMEEFTAMKCTYCPDGTRIAKTIEDKHGENFILVSLHTGTLAAPDTDFPNDFTTEEGKELYKVAGNPSQPAALIDRLDYNTPQFVKYRQGDMWVNEVDRILAQQATADIGILSEVVYDEASREICLTTKFKAVKDLSGQDLYWTAYLLESGIISPQKDGSNTIEAYEHNHMFRTSFSGTYGVPLPETFSGAVDSVACDSRQLTLNDEWVPENCSVVVFVYDNASFEVLQAVEGHVK